MGFNWEGDRILQDTAIEKKQFIIGEKKSITTDIREWISFEDNIIMKEILKELKENHKLPTAKNPGDFDKRALIVWQFVAERVKYVYDTTKYKKGDFWLFPPETYQLKKGDCEDGSFLLASLLIASGISPFCVRVILGIGHDEIAKSSGGHCWPVYKNEMGKWCILESTLDIAPARMPEADQLTEKGQTFRYEPLYCFNGHHLWEIFPGDIMSTKVKTIEKYLRAREKRVNMRKTKLPAGGWISHITGDWEPGHLEITTETLEKMEFHQNAIDVVADSSQDPDFYDWYAPAAHAQTDNDGEGRNSQSKGEAIGAYLKWVKDFTGRLVSEAKNDARKGLFYLGYLLHSIQDLATHKGITNAQHSYISKMVGTDNDPDHDEANRDKAQKYSEQFLDSFSKKHPVAYSKMKAYKGRTLPWDRLFRAEKGELLGKDWDLSPGAFIEYSGLAKKYGKIKDQYPIEQTTWDADKVFEKIITSL